MAHYRILSDAEIRSALADLARRPLASRVACQVDHAVIVDLTFLSGHCLWSFD